MTCIVAVRDSGRVWIGGDSAGVSGLDVTIRADTKVFRVGPFVMGFTTSFRMGQLLRYSLVVPDRQPGQSPNAYMVTTFVDAVRKCLKDGGWASKANDREEGGRFIVGYDGMIYDLHGDYQVGEPSQPFSACGCGQDFAMGSLAETDGMPAKERVERALAAAARFSAGVCGPMLVLSSEIAPKLVAVAAE